MNKARERGTTLQHGAGRLVVTTMNSLSAETVELTIITPDGDLETLRPTAGHKFYSVTRGEWLNATALYDGEHLNGRHGTEKPCGLPLRAFGRR